MVLRDRNHPSVVIWSLCNELGCLTNDPNGGEYVSETLRLVDKAACLICMLAVDSIVVQFKQAIQAVDTSRPITGNTVQAHFFHNEQECDCNDPSQSAACSNCQKFGDNAAAAMDVQSFSCKRRQPYPGVICPQAVQVKFPLRDRSACIDEYDVYEKYHRLTPWKAVGGGESCSCTTDRGEFDPDPEAHSGHTGPSGSQLGGLFECIEASWASVARTQYVYGNFAWTGRHLSSATSTVKSPPWNYTITASMKRFPLSLSLCLSLSLSLSLTHSSRVSIYPGRF